MAFISPKVLHCGQTGVQAESEVALVAHLQAEPAGPGWRPAKPFCLEGFRGQRSCCSLLWEPKNLGAGEEPAPTLPTADPAGSPAQCHP